MPNIFSRLKRKSNSHKPIEVSSPPSPAPRSSPPAPSSPKPRRNDEVDLPARETRPSLDVEEIPPRSTSLIASPQHIQPPSSADIDARMEKLALTATPAPQLPPLSFDSGGESSALEQQRNSLVQKIATEARARKGEGLSDAGRAAFAAAGMESEANAKGSLEVETMFLRPVVQETIIVKELVETTEIIDRHIHRHHVYPKIQPIADPDPIILEPRHRIFSALDGKWHEVVGDAAAIAILGEDVFYNGPKEHREARKMAMPGLGGEVDERAYEARVVEREGVKGEQMGTWRQLKGVAGLDVETPSHMKGEGWLLTEEEKGPVQRTVGIAL